MTELKYKPPIQRPEDRPHRERENQTARETAQSLEALNRSKAELACGSYMGDGAASRTIALGFRPKAVLLERADSRRPMEGGNHNITAGLALDGHPVGSLLRIAQGGFQVCADGSGSVNESGVTYHYLAIQ